MAADIDKVYVVPSTALDASTRHWIALPIATVLSLMVNSDSDTATLVIVSTPLDSVIVGVPVSVSSSSKSSWRSIDIIRRAPTLIEDGGLSTIGMISPVYRSYV